MVRRQGDEPQIWRQAERHLAPRLEPAPGDEALLAQHLRPLFQGDRFGRKPVLVAGWLVGLPVPLLLMWAPTWGWVVAANMLLGVNQGWRGRSRSS